jgi:small-conductance mechanosensitive channel
VYFWIEDPENGQANVRSDVNLAILATIDAMGVEIPFPQRVVRQAPSPAEPSASLPPPQPPAKPS